MRKLRGFIVFLLGMDIPVIAKYKYAFKESQETVVNVSCSYCCYLTWYPLLSHCSFPLALLVFCFEQYVELLEILIYNCESSM